MEPEMTSALQAPLTGGIATSSAIPSEPTTRPALTLRELVDAYMAAYVGRDPAIGYRLAVWLEQLGDQMVGRGNQIIRKP
jgi:hypothetical protein